MGKKINELTEITEVPSSSYILVDDGTLNNKVTKENLMKDYLPLSGGTLTGNLNIEYGTYKDITVGSDNIIDTSSSREFSEPQPVSSDIEPQADEHDFSSIILGRNNEVNASRSTIIGSGNYVEGETGGATPVTSNTTTDTTCPASYHSVLIGESNEALGDIATVIGRYNYTEGSEAVAIGSYCRASDASVAIGRATAPAYGSVAIGLYANANAYAAVGLGGSAYGKSSTAICSGYTGSEAENAISIGSMAKSEAKNTITMGYFSYAGFEDSIAIGRGAGVNGDDGAPDWSIAIGAESQVQESSGIAIGFRASATGGIAIGKNASTTSSGISIEGSSTGMAAIAIGAGAKSGGYGSAVIGRRIFAYSNAEDAGGVGGSDNKLYGKQSFAGGGRYLNAGGIGSAIFGYSSNNMSNYVSSYNPSSTTNDTLKNAWLSNKFSCAHGNYSFVCGGDNLALGEYIHIEGNNNHGYSTYGHIEGYNNYAANNPAIHIEGENNSASGSDTHVEGCGNEATGSYSHVGGYKNVGKSCQYVFGHYNTTYPGSSSSNSSSYSSLIIGNGTSSTKSNCFRVANDGSVYGLAAYSTTGADYAEYFEWQDGNINKEDRRGYFVTLDGEQIRIAKPGDYILGIVSANPAVIGNNDMQWQGHYLFDEFGSHIIEKKTIINEDGEEEEVELLAINPELDTEREYVHRSERPEWDTVGMLGVLAVHDDGTCKVNGFCECNENGIATASETGYRVIKRVNDHIVKVLFR